MTNSLDELLPIVKQKAQEFLNECNKQGVHVVVTGTYRSFAEQDHIYAQGRTTPGLIVTNAKGGQSLHNWRVAFDCVPVVGNTLCYNNDVLWSKLAQIGASTGLEWGGSWVSFPDRPHFQYTLGNSWQDFLAGKVDLTKFNLNTMEENHSATQPVDAPSTSTEIKHVVVDKVTGEEYPVTNTVFDATQLGNESLKVTTSIGEITFSNIGEQGNFLNDKYTYKQI